MIDSRSEIPSCAGLIVQASNGLLELLRLEADVERSSFFRRRNRRPGCPHGRAPRQALKMIGQYDFVDSDNVFIFGHSIGGVFGPVLAAEVPVKGVAVYGTLVKTFMEYMLENTRRQAALSGNDATSIDATLRDLAIVLHRLLVEQKTPQEIARARPELGSVLSRFAADGRISGRTPQFWAQATNRNLPAHWAKGDASVLAIWGNGDFIATGADHPLIADIVNKARPGKGTSIVLDGIDHGFRRVASMEDAFRRWGTRGEFDPQVVTTLMAWAAKVRLNR